MTQERALGLRLRTPSAGAPCWYQPPGSVSLHLSDPPEAPEKRETSVRPSVTEPWPLLVIKCRMGGRLCDCH